MAQPKTQRKMIYIENADMWRRFVVTCDLLGSSAGKEIEKWIPGFLRECETRGLRVATSIPTSREKPSKKT